MQILDQVSCSMNLGQIYSLDYSYSPQDGVGITVFFVREDGNYTLPTLLPLQKAFIRIGGASFSMYPIRRKLSLAGKRRVMEVEFVDDLFKLNHFYLALTGRGCGTNVYNLGTPVDDRELSAKLQTALDPIAQQIKEFTQFPDYAYTFQEFLTLLGTKVNLVVQASFDNTIQRDFVGTFRGVLEEWLALYNLSYFFENGQLKIFDPTTVALTLPTQSSLSAAGILSFDDEEDIRGTYGKTVFNWYQQEGGEFPLNQTEDTNGPLYVRTNTLFPMGYEFNLAQPTMPLDQVAAAQYGQNFWLLYNYVKGTAATYCGLAPITPSVTLSSVLSVAQAANNNGKVAIFDQNTYDQNYEAYSKYGEMAGRWYMSNQQGSLALDQGYNWFDESEGQIFTFENVDDKAINPIYLTPTSAGINQIPNTAINQTFPGFNYVGNRVVYQDTVPVNITGTFVLTPVNEGIVNSTYNDLFIKGVESFDLNTQLAPLYSGVNTFVAYNSAAVMPTTVTDLINGIASKTSVFAPRFTSVPIKGILRGDYASLKASQDEDDNVDVVNGNDGGTVNSNTSVIKTLKQGNYTVYYNKYSKCGSASSADSYFGYEFEANQISPDNQVDVTFTKLANNSYQINRNFDVIDAEVNPPLLSTLAQPRTFSTKRVSFTLNYFRDVPTNFLSDGLVGMSMGFSEGGARATYTYSNEILEVAGRFHENKARQEIADYGQRIRNSTLRKYQPTEVIT